MTAHLLVEHVLQGFQMQFLLLMLYSAVEHMPQWLLQMVHHVHPEASNFAPATLWPCSELLPLVTLSPVNGSKRINIKERTCYNCR